MENKKVINGEVVIVARTTKLVSTVTDILNSPSLTINGSVLIVELKETDGPVEQQLAIQSGKNAMQRLIDGRRKHV